MQEGQSAVGLFTVAMKRVRGEGKRLGMGGEALSVTLERTRPGRWSRTCSRVAAMSISFTPGDRAESGGCRRACPGANKPHKAWASLAKLGDATTRSPVGSQTHWVPGSHEGPGAVGPVGTDLTFCHAVQYHVNEDVGACPSCAITERGSW